MVTRLILLLSVTAWATVNCLEKEPHPYTISFFHFDPKDMGMAEKKESKKDIKASDMSNSTTSQNATASLNQTASTVNGTTTTPLNNTLTSSVNNATAPINNATVVANNNATTNTTTAKRNNIPLTPEQLAIERNFYRSQVLNPNPRPSSELAMHNLKQPNSQILVKDQPKVVAANIHGQLTGSTIDKSANHAPLKAPVLLYKGNKSTENMHNTVTLKEVNHQRHKLANNTVHAKNATHAKTFRLSNTTNHHSAKFNTTKLKLLKHANATTLKGNKTANLHQNKTTNLHKKADVTKNNAAAEKAAYEAKQAKLKKDKKTNQQIQEAAKNIVPVQNEVQKPDLLQDVDPSTKRSPAMLAKHRQKVSAFVPLYKNVSKKDRALSFQRGLLKHPKHNIYPKCHVCPENSTYTQCVKQSTLNSCGQNALDNICYTKSTKKYGQITYEMGCADHKRCSTARAFPCKDWTSKQCFTCCQFDRCNSSPHYGDFELDTLSMDELTSKYDEKSDAVRHIGHFVVHFIVVLVAVYVIN